MTPILDDYTQNFKQQKEPLHEEKSIMIDLIMKNQEPQMNADERRFVVPALSSSQVIIDKNQKNNRFFAYRCEKKLTPNSYELKTNSCHRSSFQFVLVRCFFSGSFMNREFKIDFVVINSANRSKPQLELKIFDHISEKRRD